MGRFQRASSLSCNLSGDASSHFSAHHSAVVSWRAVSIALPVGPGLDSQELSAKLARYARFSEPSGTLPVAGTLEAGGAHALCLIAITNLVTQIMKNPRGAHDIINNSGTSHLTR
jgi:hypothetical protein